MRKSTAFIAVLISLIIISCSGGTNTPPANPVEVDITTAITGSSASDTAVSEPIKVVGGNQEITLTGLESGKLYTIYADGHIETKSKAAIRASVVLTSLGEGAYTFVLPEGVTEITFTAREIGLQNGGEFRIGEVATPSISFQNGADGMTIGQKVTKPIYIGNDGSEHYEAFYRVDVTDIETASRVVVTEVIAHTGSVSGSHYFMFVDENGKEIPGAAEAILDLSGEDVIYLYQQMTVYESDNDDQTSTLFLLSPQTISATGTTTISNPGTYIIEPSATPQYMIVGLSRSSNRGLGVLINDVRARYCDNGKRFSGVFPIAITEDNVIVNVPAHSKSIMFDWDGDTLPVSLTTNDNTYPVETMGTGTKTFNAKEGQYIFPIMLKNVPAGVTVSLTTEIENARLRIGQVSQSGGPGGIQSVYPDGSYDFGKRRPDYIFLYNGDGTAGEFTVTIR